jgi:hypothetical protein
VKPLLLVAIEDATVLVLVVVEAVELLEELEAPTLLRRSFTPLGMASIWPTIASETVARRFTLCLAGAFLINVLTTLTLGALLVEAGLGVPSCEA